MIILTREQIADLRGCHPATVSRAGLPKADGKHYDISDPVVWAWLIEPSIQEAIRIYKAQSKDPADLASDALDDELKRRDISLKERREEKIQIEIAKARQDLIPVELVAILLGHIASGVKTNFFPLGKRLARGNLDEQKRIETEVGKAVKKTLDMAAAGLKHEAKPIAKAITQETV